MAAKVYCLVPATWTLEDLALNPCTGNSHVHLSRGQAAEFLQANTVGRQSNSVTLFPCNDVGMAFCTQRKFENITTSESLNFARVIAIFLPSGEML